MISPIHEEKSGWFFWDETGADRLGPFPTKDAAQAALNEYVRCELEGIDIPEEERIPEELYDGTQWDSFIRTMQEQDCEWCDLAGASRGHSCASCPCKCHRVVR